MESDSWATTSTPTADAASEQLEQLRRDRRWVKLTGAMPTGEDALVGTFLIVHLLSVGLLVGLSSGHISRLSWLDTDTFAVMAVLDLFMPLYGQVRWQKVQSGSWRGTPESRPSRLELAGIVASYLLGLFVVVTAAARGGWVLLVVAAVLAGVACIALYRHWMARYRAEFGYRGSRRAYALVPVIVVFSLGVNVGWAAFVAYLARLVSGL